MPQPMKGDLGRVRTVAAQGQGLTCIKLPVSASGSVTMMLYVSYDFIFNLGLFPKCWHISFLCILPTPILRDTLISNVVTLRNVKNQ